VKKRKTYEVSVINKTSSKLLSDRTKFYTSDTALELVFKLKEVEYDFDSAELILLNDEDRSLTTRPVKKTAEGFTYELEDDIVEHYGTWSGQLKFTEGDEVYVSSAVGFRIHNDLYNDRPPQLTEVNTWENLRKIADGLISDIRSELESVTEQLSEIEVAETTRQQAETQRASSESSRVSAEDQRKTDHANRSAELAGKADKVVLKNFIENGNFESESPTPSSGTISDGTLEHTGTTQTSRFAFTGTPMTEGNVYYLQFKVKADVLPAYGQVSFTGYGNSFNYRNVLQAGEWVTVSGVEKITRTTSNARPFIYLQGTAQYDDFILLNLTETFGAGNEPTKEEMDELLKVTGYIDGKYTLNNKEMLGHLMKRIGEKANKKQEDWITLPLYNGAQHGQSPLKVMKDEMGVVHFKGSLTNLTTGSKVFTLPVGYRPDIGATEGYIRVPLTLSTGREAIAIQINYIGDGYTYNSSNTMVSFFDGVSYLAKRG